MSATTAPRRPVPPHVTNFCNAVGFPVHPGNIIDDGSVHVIEDWAYILWGAPLPMGWALQRDGEIRAWCCKASSSLSPFEHGQLNRRREVAERELLAILRSAAERGRDEARPLESSTVTLAQPSNSNGQMNGSGVNPILEAALSYAARGWPVFPLKPSEKAPATQHGFKDASIEPEVIRQWWKEAPDANIGIATGSVSGLVVLDIDVKNGAAGAETLAGLESSHDGLRTLRVQTPSGGTHLYFAYGGHDIGSRTGLLPGLDIRSNGGYVVAPPSGLPGGFYQWLEEVSEPAPLPDSLQPLLREQEGEAHAHGTPFSVDDLHVGNDIKTLIREGKPKGQRSEALFGVIRAMVTAGHSNDEIAAVMLAPANGLSEKPREQGSAWLQAEIGRARVKDGRAITKRPQAAIRPPPANPRRNPLDNIRSAAELMKLDLPEPRWIVPDLLPAGLTLFAGKSKMGKSWWALQTALEVAGNGHSVC